MKLHERDWYGLVVKDRRGRKTYNNHPLTFLPTLAQSRNFVWNDKVFEYGAVRVMRFEFISTRKYFVFTGPDSDLDILLSGEDAPRLVRARGGLSFAYPCYIGVSLDPASQPEITFAAPFAGLAKEIWLTNILENGRSEILFQKCDISGLHKKMRGSGSHDELLQLRSGRAVIEPEDDPNVKSLILNGPDVMGSKLYKLLFEEGIPNFRVHLDDLYSKVAFFGEHMPSVVTYMDRNGNFRFRPGMDGRRLSSFCAFIQYLKTSKLLADELACPLLKDWNSNTPVE